MTTKYFWAGVYGPYAYDDAVYYADDGALLRRAVRIEGQMLIDTAPSANTEVVRLLDLKNIGYRQGTTDGSGVGSGKFAYISAAGIFTVGSSNDISTTIVVGCAEADIALDTACTLRFSGDMTNANWSFPGGKIGTFAYLGADGYPTANRPYGAGKITMRVGIIKNTDELILNIDYNITGL